MEMTYKLYIVLIWLSVIPYSLCRTFHSKDWDILLFTQSWPITVCLQWKESDESHTCAFPPQKNKWTVHGIWPTLLGTHGPWYCNTTWKFDENKIIPIKEELDLYWPNIQNGTSEYSLWEHEWEKHGTCSASLPQLDSERKYFEQGIKWSKQYNIAAILSQGGVNPSDQGFTVQTLMKAVKSYTHKDPFIACITDPESKQQYLLEIRLCFDKQLQLIDCDGATLSYKKDMLPTNCPLRFTVHYPGKIPKNEHWYLKLLKNVTYLQWFTW